MATDEDVRRELGAVAEQLSPPHVELAGVMRLGERERRRRRALVTTSVAAAVAVVVALVPVLAGPWARHDRVAPQPAPRPGHAAPTLRADLDGDGRPDRVVVDEPGGTVTVDPSSGGSALSWSLPRRSAIDLLGAADLGRGTHGLVLEGWTRDGGGNGAVVLIVRNGRLQRADPGWVVIDRDPTQTMWVEGGVFRHAVCRCTRGWQQVSVYRVELRADGRTLRSVEDAGRCWDPSAHRPPQRKGWPSC